MTIKQFIKEVLSWAGEVSIVVFWFIFISATAFILWSIFSYFHIGEI